LEYGDNIVYINYLGTGVPSLYRGLVSAGSNCYTGKMMTQREVRHVDIPAVIAERQAGAI
jgi:hypothetical protein